jgi:hypothetical protein
LRFGKRDEADSTRRAALPSDLHHSAALWFQPVHTRRSFAVGGSTAGTGMRWNIPGAAVCSPCWRRSTDPSRERRRRSRSESNSARAARYRASDAKASATRAASSRGLARSGYSCLPHRVAALRRNSREIVPASRPMVPPISRTPLPCARSSAISSRSPRPTVAAISWRVSGLRFGRMRAWP